MASFDPNMFSRWVLGIKDMSIWEEYTKVELVVFVVGFVAIIYILLNIFTGYTNKTPAPYVDAGVSTANMDHFEAALASSVNSPIEHGSPVEILVDGPAFFDDLLREIHNAKSSINITDYIWEEGVFGDTLLVALTEKAKQGVTVRLLLDGIGGRKVNKDLLDQFKSAGGEVAFFRPITWWNITRIYRRNHVREFVIDGRTAYMGGVAIADNWLGDGTKNTFWHDFMFKMHGKMATVSGQIFSSMWSQTTGEIYANSTKDADIEQQAISALVQNQNLRFVSLFSAPSPDLSSNMEHFWWLSISAAQKSIHIENPYLLPSKAVRNALEEKARSGVDVVLLLPGKNTDSHTVLWASQSFYYELLDAGVKIYEYQPTRNHSKIMTIDGIWSVIGSANMDNRSAMLNVEAVMGVEDPTLAKGLEVQFQKDLENSLEIKKDHYKRRILFRPFGLLLRLFTRQF